MSDHASAEQTEKKITVRKFRHRSRDITEVASVKEAISEVKREDSSNTRKISIDGEIVYNSERNGDIETWEREWKRQKRTLSVDVEAHDCPNGTVGCNKDSLCLDCKLEKARK
jgi:hypothetical protein